MSFLCLTSCLAGSAQCQVKILKHKTTCLVGYNYRPQFQWPQRSMIDLLKIWGDDVMRK